MSDSDYPAALAWLDAHVNLEKGGLGTPNLGTRTRTLEPPSLDRMRELVEFLGSPQLGFPIVHVTGTNGKSSTARMISALLAARGLSVGLYTSPHLERVNERLAWNGDPVPDDAFARVLDGVRSVESLVSERPSYFEVVTAAAFAWFAEVAVDVAVVEVGLGGTWDATNVGDGTVAVVTNVGIDHVEYLGPTREQIAREKAGIVKPGCVLVLGETDPDLVSVFVDERQPAGVHRRGVDFGVRRNVVAHMGRALDVYAPGGEMRGVYLPLHGAYQGDNAALALAAGEAFFGGQPFDAGVVAEAFGRLKVPGRMEVVSRQPLVLLDGAHNGAGARALVSSLDEEFPATDRTLVVGLLREKDPHEMLAALRADRAARLFVCRPPGPRAMDPQALAAAARDLGVPGPTIEVCAVVSEAVARALATTPPEGQVVVTGSLYTVGAARAALNLSG